MQVGKFKNNFYRNKIKFWNKKKVVITGCTGFKGAWLVLILLRYGAIVTGIALKPNDKKDIFAKANLQNKIKFYQYDINDKKKILNVFNKVKPDITFHLAAQSLVLNSYINPEETYKTNIIGSSNIIEACKALKKKISLLITTTDKVYKNTNQKSFFKENDKIGGSDPYSVSKAALEIICDYYLDLSKKSIYLSMCVARSGNVIGGGDWSKNRLFPDIARAIQHKRTLKIRNPNHTRPWQHVLDPLYGYLALIEKNYKSKKFIGCYNFGPRKNSSSKVSSVLKLTKKKSPRLKFLIKKNKLYESKYLQLNSSKAHKEVGYKQIWSLEDSVNKTLVWYNGFFKKNKVEELCLQDIKNFEKKN